MIVPVTFPNVFICQFLKGSLVNPLGFLFVAIGLFAASGSIFNWDWFMNNRKARFLVAILTRTGARVFYGLLGVGLIVFGLLFGLGIIENSS